MPSIGKDLETIRKHLGFSIQDIQNATKIPLSTLRSIENDSIFEDSEEIQTYIRSFVRSYGRALKLDDNRVVEALDQHEVGGYDGQLLKSFPELAPPEPPPAPKKEEKPETGPESREAEDPAPKSKFTPDFPEEEQKRPSPTGSSKSEQTPGSAKKKKDIKTTPPPGVRSVNWADMGKKFSTHQSNTPAKIFGVVAIILLVSAIAYYLFTNDFFVSDEMQQTENFPVPEETLTEDDDPGLALDIVDSEEQQQVPAALEDTLYLTIYAYSDRLDPVRVWSDMKPRMDPYWLEAGMAYNYEFGDTIRVRGQYSRMLLFMNGHRIDNFRQEYYNPEENAVELTRNLFENDSDWATPIPYELPPDVAEPDSVSLRPSF